MTNEEIPKKRLRLEDSGVCIFCNKPENETEKLSSPKDPGRHYSLQLN